MRMLMFILSCGLALAAPHCAANFAWIEAESPSAGNFPAPAANPYRSLEFWETDLLSGGEWIGMKWTDPKADQPFLEYQFEADEAGDYDFYARKFYTFGNFRWRVNDGAWHEADVLEHTPLDMVSLRETGERIALNWFFMGNSDLKAGTNTLRIEPVYSETTVADKKLTPLGYDAFLFTRDLFFPNGKMKPGERAGVQSSTSFAPDPPIDAFEPCAIDWRSLNEKVAGENGGLIAKDGHFAFRNTGEPVRLMGMNLSPFVLKNPRAAEHFARILSKKGINLVRFDFSHAVSFDRDAGGRLHAQVSAPLLERLAAGAEAFKKEGIYLALTWNIKNSKGILPIVPVKLEGADMAGAICPGLFFDKDLQAACRSVWKSVLETPMPGGGRLGSDPALGFITLNQQESVFADGFQPYDLIPAKQMESAEKAFGGWLASQEGDRKKLLASWGGAPVRGDQPAKGRVGLLSSLEMAARRDRRSAATARFLAESQRNFLEGLQSYLRDDLGCRSILSTSNKLASNPAALGWVNAWSLGSGDVVERHGNYLPEFEGKLSIWYASVGSRYSDRSALRFDPLPGRESLRFDLPLRSLSYPGKPVFFSELSWPLPNRFRPEMVPLATTLAALQRVDALCFNTINFPYWQSSLSAERTPAFTPAVMGQMPAFAYAFRKHLLPEAGLAAVLDISEASLFSLKPMPLQENADTQMTASSGPGTDSGTNGEESSTLWLRGRIDVRLKTQADRFQMLKDVPSPLISEGETPASPRQATVPPPALVEDAGTPVAAAPSPQFDPFPEDKGAPFHESAPAGAVQWNQKTGLLRVDAPECKVLCGFLKNAGTIAMAGVEIRSEMSFGTICLVALDGQPLALSKKILLQVFSEEANSGAYSEGDETKTIRSTGQPPILVQNLSGTVRFLRPDADQLISTALDFNGYRALTAGTGAVLNLLPSTLYYLIEK